MIDTQKITAILEELLKRVPVSYSGIELFSDESDGISRFLIKTSEPEFLIGRDGATLLAFNHLIRRMIVRGEEDVETNFIIDVNDYQKNKLNELKQKAKMMAERARFFKSSVELEPMSSYERMIVHSFLAPASDILTESVGFGPTRHVVIKFREAESL